MIEWILAITLLLLATFLLGLCTVMFYFYASKKHRYMVHIALMSVADICMTGMIVSQLIAAMFGLRYPQVIAIVLVYAALILKVGGLARMYWHRKNEEELKR